MNDDEFLAGFEACTLARPEWTHEAHVRMAWLYLTRYPLSEALERVRSGIRQLNDTFSKAEPVQEQSRFPCGQRPKQSGGYHDTITVAFVRLIAARLRDDDTFLAFRDRNPDLFDRTLTALLRHYTKKRLHSAKAKRTFIEPDLEKLPEEG
jgi:hypothetical protein